MSLNWDSEIAETGSYKKEVIKNIKEKFPNFPEMEFLVAKFVTKYPEFLSPKLLKSLTSDKTEHERLIINELLEYKNTLKAALINHIDLTFNEYLHEKAKTWIKFTNPQDIKLLNNYKILLKQALDNSINIKIMPHLEKLKISSLKLKLAESALLWSKNSIVSKIASILKD